jgi:hypothetical protein
MFESQLASLSSERLAKLPRREELGSLEFGPALAPLNSIKRIAIAYSEQPADELPANLTSQITDQLNGALALVDRIEAFEIQQQNDPTSVRNSLISELVNFDQWFLSNVRPQIHGPAIDLSELLNRARSDSETLHDLLGDAAAVVDSIRGLAGEAGSGKLSDYYGRNVRHYERSAKSYLWLSVGIFAATVILGVFLFAVFPPAHTTATGAQDWTLLVRNSVARIFFLGLASPDSSREVRELARSHDDDRLRVQVGHWPFGSDAKAAMSSKTGVI